MVPFFETGKVGSGIEATTELLVARIQNAVNGKTFDPEKEFPDLSYFSGGGGARIKTGISTGPLKKERSREQSSYQPGTSPQETLQLYTEALEKHIKDPDLPLFTPETRDFFSNWVVQTHSRITSCAPLKKLRKDN